MISRLLLLLPLALMAFAAGPPPKTFPFAYKQEDLPNGLRLITIPTDSPNLVSVYIVVRTGSRNEVEPGKTGFAHLFEHMMFRGTEKYPPEKYTELQKRAGAAYNASTSNDFTLYQTTTGKEFLPELLTMEADRFQNLKYSPEVFKTETGAVLGEYNKNSANPFSKLEEVMRDTAFDRHTYKHTTMGFLKDVQDMPAQYEYSLKFFDRYYRPEYTTIIVAGAADPKQVRALVDKSFGGWKRGQYHPDVPVEPKQEAPREGHVDWPSPTLPLLAIAYKSPAYTDTGKDTAALDLLATLAFGPNSEVYQKLVVREQKLDFIVANSFFSVDPDLFVIRARLKRAEDLAAIRQEILDTVKRYQEQLVPDAKLDAVKRRERYGFAMNLDNSETVANIVAQFVAMDRAPDTIDKIYDQTAKLTPEDLRQTAKTYLLESRRTIVSLTGAAPAGAARTGDAR